MSGITETIRRGVGYALMTGRVVLLIALLPRWTEAVLIDGRLQIIAVALCFTALLYSSSLLQPAELTLINGARFRDAWSRLGSRFGRGTGPWHRDLLVLNLLSGFLGAGVAINLQILQALSGRQTRLTAIVAALLVWAGIVLLHSGTKRFRLTPPAADS